MKFTLTIVDDSDGKSVNISIEFDPPIGEGQPETPAMYIGAKILELIKNITEKREVIK
ncbi:MAG: hypothetical protein LBQ81_08230 [Zoogloeaceae bacterium]|jgi:hypothetical protein|nr:hypothetical protein [Zoogloeaceae bacterium]